MLTALAMAIEIGQRGLLGVGKLKVPVIVKDVRQVFGRIDYLVEPVDGDGEEWVESSRVRAS